MKQRKDLLAEVAKRNIAKGGGGGGGGRNFKKKKLKKLQGNPSKHSSYQFYGVPRIRTASGTRPYSRDSQFQGNAAHFYDVPPLKGKGVVTTMDIKNARKTVR